jgi:peptidoglycan-associated lipoprotein
MRAILLLSALGLVATSASAQLPGLRKRTGPPVAQQAVPLTGIDALRADFLAQAHGDTVFFGLNSTGLDVPTRTRLAAQALWLRRHPEVAVRIEGHGDAGDTRDHALAMGARRAEEVRDYLVLLGVPLAQLSTTSWGKERPGSPRAVTVLVR